MKTRRLVVVRIPVLFSGRGAVLPHGAHSPGNGSGDDDGWLREGGPDCRTPERAGERCVLSSSEGQDESGVAC